MAASASAPSLVAPTRVGWHARYTRTMVAAGIPDEMAATAADDAMRDESEAHGRHNVGLWADPVAAASAVLREAFPDHADAYPGVQP